uniref:Uncharacterized protein n=1 Tax=Octopus bimaculoides TaxID=37653 RepID=A0A0L8HKT4_OCTBM
METVKELRSIYISIEQQKHPAKIKLSDKMETTMKKRKLSIVDLLETDATSLSPA